MNENNNFEYNMNGEKEPKKKPVWKKGLMIFAIILLVVVLLGSACGRMVNSVLGSSGEEVLNISGDYIGILEVNGVMGQEGFGEEYSQDYLIDHIDMMMDDSANRGMLLSVNTPGGSVYDIDELYLKIMEYKEKTGRPVYTYMRDMAASGGYYIAAGSDKIYANRNTWTGSIGVTVGTFMDASEFLNKMGIKTVTITAGANKAMGSSTEPMTEEQQAIFQSLVDEAYEQFTGIVAEGRKMDIETVKKLADGRVYTAKQALDNGLIDQIGTIDEAVADMMKRYELEGCSTPVMKYEDTTTLLDILTGFSDGKKNAETEVEQVMNLMEKNNKFTITYLAPVER